MSRLLFSATLLKRGHSERRSTTDRTQAEGVAVGFMWEKTYAASLVASDGTATGVPFGESTTFICFQS